MPANKLWLGVHTCKHCGNIPLRMRTCTGICIPPTVIQLGDNDHTNVYVCWVSLHESTLPNKNLACAAASLSSMGATLALHSADRYTPYYTDNFNFKK